jgi:hypothetical protein
MLPNFFTAGPQPPWAVGGALRTFPRRWRGPGKELADIGVFILFCTECAADKALQPARGCTGVRRHYFRGVRTLRSTPRHFLRPVDAFPGTGQGVGRRRCFFYYSAPIARQMKPSSQPGAAQGSGDFISEVPGHSAALPATSRGPQTRFRAPGKQLAAIGAFVSFFWLLSPITVLLRHSRGGVRAEKLFLGRARALSNTWEPFIRPVDTSAGLGQAVIEGFIFAVLGSFSGFANWGEAVFKAT